jgi:hypothetical protein
MPFGWTRQEIFALIHGLNIVQIDDDKFVEERRQNLIHTFLENCSRIRPSEWHDIPLEMSIPSRKCRLWFRSCC